MKTNNRSLVVLGILFSVLTCIFAVWVMNDIKDVPPAVASVSAAPQVEETQPQPETPSDGLIHFEGAFAPVTIAPSEK